jgi:hypothetical protein
MDIEEQREHTGQTSSLKDPSCTSNGGWRWRQRYGQSAAREIDNNKTGSLNAPSHLHSPQYDTVANADSRGSSSGGGGGGPPQASG